MNSRIRSAAALIAAWIPNMLVLAVLVGIGWWGHRHHWTLPDFFRSKASSPQAPTATARPAATGIASTSQLSPEALVERLPAVEFSSIFALD